MRRNVCTGGLVLECDEVIKLDSIYGGFIGSTLGSRYGIIICDVEVNGLGSSYGSFFGSNDGNLEGSLLEDSLG